MQTCPQQRQRHHPVQVARDEYFRIVNGLRISRALRAKVPEAADRVFARGESRAYLKGREKELLGAIPNRQRQR